MPHIKNDIGYKMGEKYNSRVNTKGQKFIKFTKANVQQEKKQNTKITNNVSHSYANASHVSHISAHNFDAFYVEIRLVKWLICILGHTTRGVRLVCGCPKCLYLM
jgi:hypothetical protein